MRLKLCPTLIALLAFICFSCNVSKKIVYFQDSQNAKDSLNKTSDTLSNIENILIQPYDVLDVKMSDASTALNTNSGTQLTGSGANNTYIVDAKGYISLPYLGSLKVINRTINDIRLMILDKLKNLLNDPYVDIHLATFKVTILGEVNHPGIIQITSEKATLIEAIALSGDVTGYGDLTEIKIVRNDKNGNPLFYLIDLTKVQSFKTVGYRLMPNDIVYIKPLKRKFVVNVLSSTISILALIQIITNIIYLSRR